MGGHTLKTRSKRQQVVALSSGEDELYALTRAASQTLGVMSTAADFGMVLGGNLHTDSTAAIGMTYRSGLGKVRHIRVQYLWLQERVADKELGLEKVEGLENPADLMTKGLAQMPLHKRMRALGDFVLEGRASTAPGIGTVARGDKWSERGNQGRWTRIHSTPQKVSVYTAQGGKRAEGGHETHDYEVH